MELQQKEAEEPSAVAGVVFLLILLAIGIGIYMVFIRARPPVIALSAYFVDSNGTPLPAQVNSQQPLKSRLRIKGEVRKNEKPEPQGTVLVSVNKTDLKFEQTVAVDLKPNGQFETEDDAFTSLLPDSPIHIRAEYLTTDWLGNPTEDLYLNTDRPTAIATITAWAFVAVLLIAIGFFFYSFTGAKTDRKNQYAIIFSYCIIIIFLAVPLLAPVVLLNAFPNSRRNMVGAPVGLIVTCVGDPKDCKVQWALNIGGYSTWATPTPSPTPAASATPSPAGTATPSPAAGARPTSVTQPTLATPTPQPGNTPQPSPANPTPQPTNTTQSSPATPTPVPAEKATTAKPECAKDCDVSNSVTNVQGGLVIPLFVIVLSVIGGAINMTRKVPRLQSEGEQAVLSVKPLRALKSLWARFNPTKKARELRRAQAAQRLAEKKAETSPEVGAPSDATAEAAITSPPLPASGAAETGRPTADSRDTAEAKEKTDEDKANEIDTELASRVESYFESDSAAQVAKKKIKDLAESMQKLFDERKDKKPILGFDSFDEWMASRPVLKEMFTSHWRVELLNQYMYLISAPFLAIVAYYMLDLLGLTRLPILVLISFSVGLISEKILNWLLSLASSYLRSDSPTQTAVR